MVLFSIIFLSVLFLLLFLKISVQISVKMISKNIEVEIYIPILFLKRKIQIEKNKEKFKRVNTFSKKINLKSNWQFAYEKGKKILFTFLKKSYLKDTSWQTVFGVGDAALTGSLTGVIWSWKTTILGSISHLVKMEDLPEINVIPQFNSNYFETEFKCILSFRIGHLIRAGVQFMYLIFRLYRMSKITTNASHDFKT